MVWGLGVWDLGFRVHVSFRLLGCKAELSRAVASLRFLSIKLWVKVEHLQMTGQSSTADVSVYLATHP